MADFEMMISAAVMDNMLSNRYIIVGLSIDGDPVSTVHDGMDAIQGSVEKLVTHGYTPIGGLSMCTDAKGVVHLSQAMFNYSEPAPVVVS